MDGAGTNKEWTEREVDTTAGSRSEDMTTTPRQGNTILAPNTDREAWSSKVV